MKNIKLVLSIILFVCLAFIFTGCGEEKKSSLDDYISSFKESIVDCKSVVSTNEIHDHDVLVYKYNKEITYTDGEIANVIKTTNSLNSSIEFEEKVDEQYGITVSKNSLLNLNCKSDDVLDYVNEKGIITFSVNKDNINKVFGDIKIEIEDNVHFTLNYENNKLLSFTCSYKTVEGRNVNINSTFTY